MLQKLVLQNFRNYPQHVFSFDAAYTVIIGANTAGKTNMVEALMLLATGKSFRAEKDSDMIQFGQEIARVQGLSVDRVNHEEEKVKLEVTLAQGEASGGRFLKQYKVNDVPKSRNHFVGFLPMVVFRPEALEIIIDGPSLRRQFLDEVLEQVDSHYRIAKTTYDKTLRQRNALLNLAAETGKRNTEQFSYWDEMLVRNGSIITKARETFLTYINTSNKDIFPCTVHYDASVMSYDRLAQYADAEIGAKATLVGPQRDDFFVTMEGDYDIEHFASRGQQRLAVLQLKLLQMAYIELRLEKKPVLVLDDIFSELDAHHIQLVLERVQGSQIILTTTHEEFIQSIVAQAHVIKLD